MLKIAGSRVTTEDLAKHGAGTKNAKDAGTVKPPSPSASSMKPMVKDRQGAKHTETK